MPRFLVVVAAISIACLHAGSTPGAAGAHTGDGSASFRQVPVLQGPIVREAPAFGFPGLREGVVLADPADGAAFNGRPSITVSGTARILTGRVAFDGAELEVRDDVGGTAGRLKLRTPIECTNNCDMKVGGPRSFRLGPVTLPASALPDADERGSRTLILRLRAIDNPSVGRTSTFTDTATLTFGAPTPKPNFFVEAVEVNQAIQSSNVRGTRTRSTTTPRIDYPTSVPLIAKKSTVVRLLPNVEQSRTNVPLPPQANVTALLRGFRDGEELTRSPLRPEQVTSVEPFTAFTGGSAVRALFNSLGREIVWRLPTDFLSRWTDAGRTRLRVELNTVHPRENVRNSPEAIQECAGCFDAANTLETTVAFQKAPDVLFDPFRIEYDPPGNAPPVGPPDDFEAEVADLERSFPVPDGGVTKGFGAPTGVIRTENRECADVLNRVFAAGLTSSERGMAVGIMPNHPDMCRVSNNVFTADDDFQAAGMGAVNFAAIWRTRANNGLTAAHEVGHTLGLPHASCSHGEGLDGAGGCDADHRPAHARLGGNGYSVKTLTRYPEEIDADRHHEDLMSYGGPRWVSTTTYGRLLTELENRAGDSGVAGLRRSAGSRPDDGAATRAVGSPRDSLVVTATVGPGSSSSIGRAVRLTVASRPLGLAGTHALRALDGAGQTVAVHRFDLNPTAIHGPPITVAGATFPDPERIAALTIESSETVLARRDASPASPTVAWTDPPSPNPFEAAGTRRVSWTAGDGDGEELSYVVQFSRDGATGWRTLDPQVPGLTYDVDLARLPSTTSGRFRVIATDGLRSSMDEAGAAVRIPNHAPTAAIATPRDGAGTIAGATLTLDGTGADIDEAVSGAQMRWRSTRDGDLGTGRSLSARLSVGAHIISLEVTDQQGARDADQVRVIVARAPGARDVRAPRLLRARRVDARTVRLSSSEEVIGLGSRAIFARGAGRIEQIDYEPRTRSAIVRFARPLVGRRIRVGRPVMDAAGNAVRGRTVTVGR